MYKSFKRKKAKKLNIEGAQNAEESEDDDEEDRYTTRKCPLASILRPKYKHILTNQITENSISATKICGLGSLLFLEQVQSAYDAGNQAFFNQDGQLVIKNCFHAVLRQNTRMRHQMSAEFVHFVENVDEQFEWPNNRNFGNGTKDLIKQYVTNVTTNLKTHREDRLVNFLKLKVPAQHCSESNICLLAKGHYKCRKSSDF